MQVPPSVSTGYRNKVVRQLWRCAAIQKLVNCHCQLEKHLVRNVEPVKFLLQYLTQAAFKLPSDGDDTRSSIQHDVTCPLLSLVHQQEQSAVCTCTCDSTLRSDLIKNAEVMHYH